MLPRFLQGKVHGLQNWEAALLINKKKDKACIVLATNRNLVLLSKLLLSLQWKMLSLHTLMILNWYLHAVPCMMISQQLLPQYSFSGTAVSWGARDAQCWNVSNFLSFSYFQCEVAITYNRSPPTQMTQVSSPKADFPRAKRINLFILG